MIITLVLKLWKYKYKGVVYLLKISSSIICSIHKKTILGIITLKFLKNSWNILPHVPLIKH